ncbi:ABC transporter substrate-binding protein [Kitasatospora cineracea]|uniref:Peptide/nickel transport system substrate-binding protein n=1 Tax=Kitasatospora cineracea TaxID=88074 RepID=A0A8G1XEU1_9ACTN|nr:ABC transporter substrate-binding protein [Kitasatospora cineracea]ROR46533.1 peptide/nickel transport system substrate-binding protein [Kitasatospora cineracea]
MRRVRKTWGLRAAAGLLAGTTLVACSGQGGQNTAGPKVEASKLVSKLPDPKGNVSTVKWNVYGEPETLDPRNAVNYGSGQITRNMCEGLFKMDPEFKVSENLASAYQQVSPTELKLTIRAGVKFWDGKPLTAEDVAYSLKRSAAEDSVVNFGFIFVKGIQATGPMEVTLTFSQPDANFVDNLATLAGVVIEKDWAEKTGDKVGTSTGGLMCTGPYKFGSWQSGTGITIQRNDAYWNADLKPRAAEIDFSFIADDTALAQALDAGEIDGSYELPPSTLAKLLKSKSGQVVFGPSTQSTALSVANPGTPLADAKLRDAFQRSLDREAIAKVIFNGAAEPNYTELTPETWPTAERSLYQPDYDKWVKARSYDPEAAKKLVKESTYDGRPLVLAIMAGDETASRVAQLVQQQAKAIGVTVTIQTMQPLVYAQASYDATKRQGIDLLYSSSFNSRQEPLEPLGFDLIPEQAYNYTNFNVPEVTELLTGARSSFDAKERAAMIVKAQEIYEPLNGVISLVSNNAATFVNNRLTGAVTSFAYWSMPQMAYLGAAK